MGADLLQSRGTSPEPISKSDGDAVPPERLVGYIRISTDEQTHALQRDAMIRAGVDPDLIYSDIESGWKRKKERIGLRNALKACRRGGTLLVWKLDRLGRNTVEIIVTVHRLQERGIHFRSITQPQIDTRFIRSGTEKFIFHMFAALAELESDQTSERTRAGQQAAKARGVRFGRKTFQELYVDTGLVARFQELRREGVPVKMAVREIGGKWSTYRKYKHVFEPPPEVDDVGSAEGEPVDDIR